MHCRSLLSENSGQISIQDSNTKCVCKSNLNSNFRTKVRTSFNIPTCHHYCNRFFAPLFVWVFHRLVSVSIFVLINPIFYFNLFLMFCWTHFGCCFGKWLQVPRLIFLTIKCTTRHRSYRHQTLLLHKLISLHHITVK